MSEFDTLVSLILEEADGKGMNTYWEDGDIKITIKEVIKYLDDNNIKAEDIPLSKLKSILIDQDYKGKAKDRVENADLSYPIIVVKSKGKLKSILDGNHRVYKALNADKDSIKGRVIDLDDKRTPKEYKELFDYQIEVHEDKS